MNNFAALARQLDAEDSLKSYRDLFSLPQDKIYLCTNSLGLPVKSVSHTLNHHLTKWSQTGAHGWFHGEDNWYSAIDEQLRTPLANILGAKTSEVVVMNSLTINLHLLLTSFYRPTRDRYKIVMEGPVFPSDLFAIKSHLINQGYAPETALIIVEPAQPDSPLQQEAIDDILRKQGKEIALVFLSAVNYLTGQAFDIEQLTALAHREGCVMGLNLAHAAGNIPLALHQHQVDFAVGCSYKYLCSGPGGPGIAFVHENHHTKTLPRLAGWWGNDPATRFRMDETNDFIPHGGATSWQVSTPSILGMLPLIESLQLFQKASLSRLHEKSKMQTAFLLEMLSRLSDRLDIVTPKPPNKRGCQVSLRIPTAGNDLVEQLFQRGVICDFRPPHMIRVAPSPFYTSFDDIYRFVEAVRTLLSM